MLTVDEIRRKAEAMERLALEADETRAKAYRDIAAQWRLLEIEAVYMEAMERSVAPGSQPPPQRS
jgi:hypothetical protein